MSQSATPPQDPNNRQDQIVHRFYLKTVGVLVDGRLTHHGGDSVGASGKGKSREGNGKEVRIDKWFNLPLPDPDLFRSDLSIYKSLSTTFSTRSHSSSTGSLPDLVGVPPLLIAFTLDVGDLRGGDGRGRGALMFRLSNGESRKIDTGDGVKGIVLEQWTLSCLSALGSRESSIDDVRGGGGGTTGGTNTATHRRERERERERPTYIPPSSSSAYKSGIIHFRALYQYIRLLPAYALYRRLKRKTNGLKIGIKMWCAEGWDGDYRVPKGGISDASTAEGEGDGLRDAWEKMENGLIGLEDRSGGDGGIKDFSFPGVILGNGVFTLNCRSRKITDYWIEDPEAALSTGFAREDANAAATREGFDLNEEYFTPTLARRRTSSSGDRPSSLPDEGLNRRMAGLSATRPTELQAQRRRSIEVEAAAAATAMTTGEKSNGDVIGSTGSLRRWSNLGEGLPFAIPQGQSRPDIDRLRTSSLSGRSSPGSIGISRRLSSDGSRSNLQDQGSTGRLGVTPPSASVLRPGTSYEARPGSSLPRSGSFLSQSGRSFTRLNEVQARQGQGHGPASGQLGSSAGSHRQSALSPSSGSFQRSMTNSAIAQLPRPPLASHSTTPAQLPPTFEEGSPENSETMPSLSRANSASPRAAPQMIKRYSASLGQRQPLRNVTTPATASSGGSSVGQSGGVLGRSAGGPSGTYGSLTRTSTRGSVDGVPGSLGNSNRFLGTSLSRVTSSSSPGDGDEINLFLKTLDNMPRPPSIAASTSALRPHLPSTSSSLSATHTTSASSSTRTGVTMTPAVSHSASPSTPSSAHSSAMMRKPLTKTQVDDTLRRMANSFAGSAGPVFAMTAGLAPGPTPEGPTTAPPSLPSGNPPSPSRRPSSSTSTTRLPTSYIANKQATDAITEMMTGGGAIGIPHSLRGSPTNRDVTSLVSRTSTSSVKSSSPLAGAPILAMPESGPPSPGATLQPQSEPALLALPASPALLLTMPLERSTRTNSTASTIEGESETTVFGSRMRRLRPEEVPLPAELVPSISRQPSADTERERRRPPVLLRGGFSQFSSTQPRSGNKAVTEYDQACLAHSLSGNGGGVGQRSKSMHPQPGSRSPMSMPERDPILGRQGGLDLMDDRRRGHGTSDGRVTPSMMPVYSTKGFDRPISPSPWLGPSRVITSATSTPLVVGGELPVLGGEGEEARDSEAPSSLGSREALVNDRGYVGRWRVGGVGISETEDVPSPWDDDEVAQGRRGSPDGDDGIVGKMEMSEQRRGRG